MARVLGRLSGWLSLLLAQSIHEVRKKFPCRHEIVALHRTACGPYPFSAPFKRTPGSVRAFHRVYSRRSKPPMFLELGDGILLHAVATGEDWPVRANLIKPRPQRRRHQHPEKQQATPAPNQPSEGAACRVPRTLFQRLQIRLNVRQFLRIKDVAHRRHRRESEIFKPLRQNLARLQQTLADVGGS